MDASRLSRKAVNLEGILASTQMKAPTSKPKQSKDGSDVCTYTVGVCLDHLNSDFVGLFIVHTFYSLS